MALATNIPRIIAIIISLMGDLSNPKIVSPNQRAEMLANLMMLKESVAIALDFLSN